jgi:hypothetical protein
MLLTGGAAWPTLLRLHPSYVNAALSVSHLAHNACLGQVPALHCCGATRLMYSSAPASAVTERLKVLRMTIENSTLLLPADEVGSYPLFHLGHRTCCPGRVVADPMP